MPLCDFFCEQSEDECPADDSDDTRLKNQERTAKARVASQLSFQKRRLEQKYKIQQQDQLETDEACKARFQREFLASAATQWNPCEDVPTENSSSTTQANDRRRAVYMYFKSFAKAVRKLFFGPQQQEGLDARDASPQISHVISINTNDDTNIRLGSGKRGSSEVRSVMNNIQQHVVVKEPLALDDLPAAWFSVHQPLVVLERADTSNLYAEFMSWVLSFANYVGWRFRLWGMPSNLFQKVQSQVFCFVGDALRVNDALFKRLTQAVQEQTSDQTCKSFAFQVHCGIHQVSLTRKTLALGFAGYWSTLVRLGHLFSSHTFRQKFKASMAKLVQENFQFLKVAQLPPETAEWNKLKIDQLRLHTDTGHMGFGGGARKNLPISKRIKAISKLMQKDNGNPRDSTFCHWCTGSSCCPGGKDEALSCLIMSYLDLFDYMCVPLLYRWKHAMAANNFVRDGFFWHAILPRTLQAMPNLKSHPPW